MSTNKTCVVSLVLILSLDHMSCTPAACTSRSGSSLQLYSIGRNRMFISGCCRSGRILPRKVGMNDKRLAHFLFMYSHVTTCSTIVGRTHPFPRLSFAQYVLTFILQSVKYMAHTIMSQINLSFRYTIL